MNEVAADYVLKEAVKSPRDEQHEAALEQMKAGCDKGGGGGDESGRGEGWGVEKDEGEVEKEHED